MQPPVVPVFISSTFLDLEAERSAVERALSKLRQAKFIGMEHFGSRDETTSRVSLDEVNQSQLYVGIFASRYGSGITEAEYRRAQECGLYSLIFFKQEEAIPLAWREADPEKAQLLASLKEELRGKHLVYTFGSPDELALEVTNGFYRWLFDHDLRQPISSSLPDQMWTTSSAGPAGLRMSLVNELGAVVDSDSSPAANLRPRKAIPGLRAFPDLLDRTVEVDTALAASRSTLPVELCGEVGSGKTSLLRCLAFHPQTESLRDGTTYLARIGKKPVADLLQLVFDSFYESDPQWKPREAELRHSLVDRQARILLDDIDLERDSIEDILNAVPQSGFLIATRQRQLFGEAKVVPVSGLPLTEALLLLEREMGRPIASAERPAAESLCRATKGHPWRLLRAASIARGNHWTLEKVATDPDGRLRQEAIQEPAENNVLAVLAAAGGNPLRAVTIGMVTEVQPVEPTLNLLEEKLLIERQGSGYCLRTHEFQATFDIGLWREKLLEHFATRSLEPASPEKDTLDESDAVGYLLSWAAQTGRTTQAVRLARLLDKPLCLGRRWSAWAATLETGYQAAHAAGDPASEAWACHQLGSRALCLGERETARRLLSRAFKQRSEIGDHWGAAVTRHNLDLLVPAAISGKTVTTKEPEPSVGTASLIAKNVRKKLKAGGLFAGLAAGLLGLTALVAVARLVNDRWPLFRGDEPVSTSSPSPGSATPEPSAQPSLTPSAMVALLQTPEPTPSTLATPSPTLATPTATAVATPSSTATPTPTPPPTPTSTPTASPTRTPAPMAEIRINPDEIAFGRQDIGTKSDERRIRISNEGQGLLIVSSVKLSGDAEDDYSVTENCSGRQIRFGDRCEIRVTFAPRSERARRAELIVSHNAGGDMGAIALAGIGARTDTRPSIDASPKLLDFGEQQLERDSKVRAVRFVNEGSAPYRVATVRLVDQSRTTRSFEVVQDGCRDVELAPKASCVVRVVFTPRDLEKRTAFLTLENASVLLRGVGVAPASTPPSTPPSTPTQGWCCRSGKVFESPAAECKKNRGFFSDEKAKAEKRCKLN